MASDCELSGFSTPEVLWSGDSEFPKVLKPKFNVG
jgi:hypothetical protein